MLLNYIRIQFVRFFNSINYALFLVLFTVLGSVLSYLAMVGFDYLNLIYERTSVDYGLHRTFYFMFVMYFQPLICGLISVVFFANYYVTRSHINLEIKKGGIFLYTLSEAIFIFVPVLFFTVLFLIAFEAVPEELPWSVQLDALKKYGADIALLFFSTYANCIYALMIAKLLRKRWLAILVYFATYFISLAFVGFEYVRYFFGLVYVIPENTPMAIVGMFTKTIAFFAMSVVFGKIKYEERIL